MNFAKQAFALCVLQSATQAVNLGQANVNPYVQSIFDRLDSNGDGVINMSEAAMTRLEDRLGEFDATGPAVKELQPQVGLQRLDLVADRGMGDAKFLGRVLEAQVPGRGLEGAKLVQVRQASGHGSTS